MHKEETFTTNMPPVQADAVYAFPGRGDVAAAAHPDGTYERQAKETEPSLPEQPCPRAQAKSSQPLTRSKLRSIRLMTKVYVRTRGLLRSGAKLASSGRVEDSMRFLLVQQTGYPGSRGPLVLRFL